MAVTAQDKREFKAYLEGCTDNQVRGVLEKEKAAHRTAYVTLAKAEMAARNLS
ncbi:hypothetical protein AB4Y45_33580 [Paraburkholderia sp. EG287A]|uniref:hypothetical protein n=1 Tax=Paraburkholderia sp. EG287A TaxID=3237012 RepID=UPI0034D24FE9